MTERATEIRCTYIGGRLDGTTAFVPAIGLHAEQSPVKATNKNNEPLFETYVRVGHQMRLIGHVPFGREHVIAACRAEGITGIEGIG
jgi:hypothetical protein